MFAVKVKILRWTEQNNVEVQLTNDGNIEFGMSMLHDAELDERYFNICFAQSSQMRLSDFLIGDGFMHRESWHD